MTFDSLGKGGDAISALKKAADLSPTTARYQRDYGEILFAGKKLEPALLALEKAVAADPADAQAWGALARTRVALRKYDKAAEAYEKVVALHPDDPTMRILLGALYHEYLKNYEKALEHYNRCLALGGEFANLQDWIDECTAEMEKKQGK
jgi:tetratricopeptide (TPR) repeat protein